MPRIPRGPWLEEFNNKGIRFNDFESSSEIIDLIIGSQYIQQMLTGRRVESSYGYTAVETVFGWTLTGALNKANNNEQNMAMLVTSMLVNEADITQLWRLDTIGIRDPIKTKSNVERDSQAAHNLVKTLERKSNSVVIQSVSPGKREKSFHQIIKKWWRRD